MGFISFLHNPIKNKIPNEYTSGMLGKPIRGINIRYKGKVISEDNETINDAGDNNFTINETIAYTITLIQPDGGESWARGTSHPISWMDNFPGTVDIELWKNYAKVSDIATGVAGASYQWNIPGGTTAGADYKVKVYRNGNHSVVDSSTAFFEITLTASGFIEVLQPDGGEEWLRGTSHLISWTDNLAGTVSLELWKGAAKDSDIATGVTGSTYNWNIPAGQATGTDYSVVVISDDDPAISDESDADFTIVETIPGTITVLQPNVSGLQWVRGYEYWISWIDNLTTENVDIELWKGDVKDSDIATDVAGSTYIWTIPSGQTLGVDYSIKVRGHISTTIEDEGDNDFEILAYTPGGSVTVLQPNGGEEWVLNNQYWVSWVDNLFENVNINLLDVTDPNNPVVTSIATDVPGSTYIWLIDDATFQAGNNYKIAVTGSVNTALTDTSDAVFSIIDSPGGEIEVIQPNGGEEWTVGNSYWISWVDNIVANVSIELIDSASYAPALQDTFLIATNVPGSTHIWTIPGTVGTGDHFKIRVFLGADEDLSDATFTINPAVLALVYPNPANNQISLQLLETTPDNYSVMLYNRFNSLVYQKNISTFGPERIHLPAAHLPEGIYFVVLKSEKAVFTSKVVVQH